jgi:putative spermidine/putrescine transport system ATP-binding protein
MSAGALELRHLRKRYGDLHAVDDISLILQSGEFMTLLGPSGSGKTTTLAMIAGLVQPSDGTILLDGQPLDPLPPYRRNIGMVFQNYALFPHLTAARNVAFPLEMRRIPARDIAAKVTRALAQVGLAQHGGRYPRQLSGGQQQRVALARAMVFEPSILLMDEPLGALDRKLREQMQIEIMRLHRELGISVVYVTHDQDEALMMSDRIALFNRGRIEQIGTPQDLYDRPATLFVADFLGESNFFAAKVVETSPTHCRLNGGDLQLTARANDELSAGCAAVIVVRPERIILAVADRPSERLENSVHGTLTEVIYLGRSRKYTVRLASGQNVTALEQTISSALSIAAPGDTVRLAWQAEDAIALPARTMDVTDD